MSEGWSVYTVLLKHHLANILCFLLKLCKFQYVWGNYKISGILKFD